MRPVAERRRARSLHAVAVLAVAGAPLAWCRAIVRTAGGVAALDERLAAVCRHVPATPTLAPANLLGATLEACVDAIAGEGAGAEPVGIAPAAPAAVTDPTQPRDHRQPSGADERRTTAPTESRQAWISGAPSERLGRRPATDESADQAGIAGKAPLPDRGVRLPYARLRTLADSADAQRPAATQPGLRRRRAPRVTARVNPAGPTERLTPRLPRLDVAEHVERVAIRVLRRIGGDVQAWPELLSHPLPGSFDASSSELRRTLDRWSGPSGAAALAGMPGIIQSNPASVKRTDPETAANRTTARRAARRRPNARIEHPGADTSSIPVAQPVIGSPASGQGPGAVGELHRLQAPGVDGLMPTVAGYPEQPGQPARLADLADDQPASVERPGGVSRRRVVNPGVEPSAHDTSAVAGVGNTVPTVSAPELERVLGRVLTDAARRHGIEV